MKITMKLFTFSFLCIALLFTACSKDGDTGPAGPQGIAGIDGTDGEDGTNGTNGTDGNANVELIEFGTRTFTGTTSYLMTGVSNSDINSNLFIAFYGREYTEISGGGGILQKTQWLPVPGKGEDGLFETNAVIEGSSTSFNSEYIVTLYNLNGSAYTSEKTFLKFKIFIVPPTSATGKSSNENLLSMSYSEFIEHFGL